MTAWLSAFILGSTLVPVAPAQPVVATPTAVEEAADADDDADDEGEDEDETEATGVDAESESSATSDAVGDGRPVYSKDLSQTELERRFKTDLASLGSISVGFADAGRLVNGVHMGQDPGEAWTLVVPERAWGTQETIDFLKTVSRQVKQQFPLVGPVRVNHIGCKEGGYLRPHKSHQSGRDADIGLIYKNNQNPGGGRRVNRIAFMDMGANWAFVRAVMTMTDVQVLLVDTKIQHALYDYALSIGEDKAWLDTLFFTAHAPIQHARRHKDHFHVRFFSPRSQELGLRIHPLLAHQPDQNLVMHRVKRGDTLGGIARKYGSGIAAIQKRNGMRNSFLSLGRSLVVPLRGPCTQCPVPPPVVIPQRHTPSQGLLAVIPVSTQPPRSNSTLSTFSTHIAKPMGLGAPLE